MHSKKAKFPKINEGAYFTLQYTPKIERFQCVNLIYSAR